MKALVLDPVQNLQETFGDAIERVDHFRDETTIVVKAEKIAEVVQHIRDTKGLEYNYLADIAGIDYLPQTPRFGVCYHFYSLPTNRRLRLKVLWNEGETPVPTVSKLFPSANWEEREAYDMFGIIFADHLDLRRILMPEDWEGFPQRKDAPLGYETVQFSFNFDEVQKHKPYAKK